jgi:hypothetical protein
VENITNDMLRFKEAVRHIWNAYLANKSRVSPEIWSSFEMIERELLRSIVLLPRKASVFADDYRKKPISQILVHPTSTTREVPIQFGKRDRNHNMVWRLEKKIPAKKIPTFHFLEFFSWNPWGQIDLSYVKVKDAKDGRIAIIEQTYCEFTVVRGNKK